MTILPAADSERVLLIGITVSGAIAAIIAAVMAGWLFAAASALICTLCAAVLIAIERSEIEAPLYDSLGAAAADDHETAAALRALCDGPEMRVRSTNTTESQPLITNDRKSDFAPTPLTAF